MASSESSRSKSCEKYRSLIVHKDDSGYGLILCGDKPTRVQTVKPGGASHRAGVREGDVIIKVNGQQVTDFLHSKVVELIQASNYVALTVVPTSRILGATSGDSAASQLARKESTYRSNNTSITGPRPVDEELQRRVQDERKHALHLMVEQTTREIDDIKLKMARSNSKNLWHQLQNKERVLADLEHQRSQLAQISGRPATGGGLSPSPDKMEFAGGSRLLLQQQHQSGAVSVGSPLLSRFMSGGGGGAASPPPVAPPRSESMLHLLANDSSLHHNQKPPPLPDRHSRDDQAPPTPPPRTCLPPPSANNNNTRNPSAFNQRYSSQENINSSGSPALPPSNSGSRRTSHTSPSSHQPVSPGKSVAISHSRTRSSPSSLEQTLEAARMYGLDGSQLLGGRLPGSRSPRYETPPGTPPPPYEMPDLDNNNVSSGSSIDNRYSGGHLSKVGVGSGNDTNRNLVTWNSLLSPGATDGTPNIVHDIISMEEDDEEDEDEGLMGGHGGGSARGLGGIGGRHTLPPEGDHGPFNSLHELLMHPAHLAVFLQYVMCNSDPAPLLFYLITDAYKQGSPKEMRKWAYEIHSCFIIPSAPLKLPNIDTQIIEQIDNYLEEDHTEREDHLGTLFGKVRKQTSTVIKQQLGDFRGKRVAGLAGMFGPSDSELKVCDENPSTRLQVIEKTLFPHLETMYEDLENATDKSSTLCSSLATVLLRNFSLKSASVINMIEKIPIFVSKEKKREKFLGRGLKKYNINHKGHNFVLKHYEQLTYCSHTHELLWGIGPQGYHCQNCQFDVHKKHVLNVEESCVGPSAEKKKSNRKSLNFPSFTSKISDVGRIMSKDQLSVLDPNSPATGAVSPASTSSPAGGGGKRAAGVSPSPSFNLHSAQSPSSGFRSYTQGLFGSADNSPQQQTTTGQMSSSSLSQPGGLMSSIDDSTASLTSSSTTNTADCPDSQQQLATSGGGVVTRRSVEPSEYNNNNNSGSNRSSCGGLLETSAAKLLGSGESVQSFGRSEFYDGGRVKHGSAGSATGGSASGSGIRRSESAKDGTGQKRPMTQARAFSRKHSDPNLTGSGLSGSPSMSASSIAMMGVGSSNKSGSSSNNSLTSGANLGETVGGHGLDQQQNDNEDASGAGRDHSADMEGGMSPQADSFAAWSLDPPDWRTTIPSDRLSKITAKEAKRQDIINELYHTEANHVRNLRTLNDVFRVPLLNLKSDMLPPEFVNRLFPNIVEVHNLHKHFYEAMKTTIQQGGGYPVGAIGAVLQEMFSGPAGDRLIQASAEFTQDQKFTIEELKRFRAKDSRLDMQLAEMERHPACRRLQLQSLLPVQHQRLVKYPLLLGGLAKHSDQTRDQAEYETVVEVTARTRQILEKIDSLVAAAENKQKLIEIQRNLDTSGLEKLGHDDPIYIEFRNIDLTKHRLIYDGMLTLNLGAEGRRSKSVDLLVLLLEDCVLFLQKQDDKYLLRTFTAPSDPNSSRGSGQDSSKKINPPVVKFSNLLVRENATSKRGFYLINMPQHSTHEAQLNELKAASPAERKTWIDQLIKASTQFKARKSQQVGGSFSGAPSGRMTREYRGSTSSTSILTGGAGGRSHPAPLESTAGGSNFSVAARSQSFNENSSVMLMRGARDERGFPIGIQNRPLPSPPTESVTNSGAGDLGGQTEDLNIPGPTQPLHVRSNLETLDTKMEKLLAKDIEIAQALEEKQKIVADIFNIPPEEYETLPDFVSMHEDKKDARELLLATLDQVNHLTHFINDSLKVNDVNERPPRLLTPPSERLVQIASNLRCHVSTLLAIMPDADLDTSTLGAGALSQLASVTSASGLGLLSGSPTSSTVATPSTTTSIWRGEVIVSGATSYPDRSIGGSGGGGGDYSVDLAAGGQRDSFLSSSISPVESLHLLSSSSRPNSYLSRGSTEEDGLGISHDLLATAAAAHQHHGGEVANLGLDAEEDGIKAEVDIINKDEADDDDEELDHDGEDEPDGADNPKAEADGSVRVISIVEVDSNNDQVDSNDDNDEVVEEVGEIADESLQEAVLQVSSEANPTSEC